MSAIPVAPSMASSRVPAVIDARTVRISVLALCLGVGAACVAQLLGPAIGLVTNLAFFGRLSFVNVAPEAAHAAAWRVMLMPMLGGLLVGLLARYGSRAIRGHGIPEAMEQVLTNESRIPARIMLLKPLSAAVAIGTGGPFGAEGPIIATGGALGSWLGQWLPVSAAERKTLLACGAAAGMAATFGSPVSAVLLAVELLLFEFRPRSMVPVALAAAMATAIRLAWVGAHPAFSIPPLFEVSAISLLGYLVQGALFGVLAALVTRAVYAIEDTFERLPVHWMWWPALGGIVVGVCGLISPKTLGVGYDNIESLLTGSWAPMFVATLCVVKFVSWSVALGSGTSGGTLAPLFTVGGALGSLYGSALAMVLPGLGVEPRVAALVGMASLFAGASRAWMASVLFAFETTRQPAGLLPLLVGCTSAFAVTSLLQRHSIMTEKIARRGVRVIGEYSADVLARLHAGSVASRNVITLRATDSVTEALSTLDTLGASVMHQAFPVVDEENRLEGVVTRRELFAQSDSPSVLALVHRPPVWLYEDDSLRDAAEKMRVENVGRLPVVSRATGRVVGILSRSDLLNVHIGEH